MSKLEELIQQLCPNGVEYKKLNEAVDIRRGVRVVRSQLSSSGEYPVYQNSLTPLGYYEKYNVNADTAFVIVAGAAGEIGYSTVNFWAADDCFYFEGGKTICNKFIYYVLTKNKQLLLSKVRKASIPRLSRMAIEQILVPVPPLEVQREIVRILDNFTDLIDELTVKLSAELTARKKQYEYYQTKLFSFGNAAVYMPLAEIAEIGTGSSNTNEGLAEGKYPFFVRSQDVRRKNEYEYDETAIITSGDGVGVGKIFHYIEGKYALHQRAYRIHITDERIIPKYFYYYMKATFLPYIEKASFHSSVTSIRRPMLNKFPVPVVSIDRQRRIVSILDRFDALCNDLTSGLPAEIAARQKQYEYYRDKLLTFQDA